jgi:hypothetical protein
MRRQALVVLGMHRSGTSALTRVLSLLGADLPNTLMIANDDNRTGYWESPRIARFNNQLLASAGLQWDSDDAIAADWFADEQARAPHYEEARSLIKDEYADSTCFTFKDPRLCRLFPFWERVLVADGIEPIVLLAQRHPFEVAASLAARYRDPRLHFAAIRAQGRIALLWLRHLLEAERSTRHVRRIVVEYPSLLSDWRGELAGLQRFCPRLDVAGRDEQRGAQVDRFLDPSLRRHAASPALGTNGSPEFFTAAMGAVKVAASSVRHAALLDGFTRELERLLGAYAPLRATVDRLADRDVWADRAVQELQTLHAVPQRPHSSSSDRPSVLFVSRTPESRAHHYRVLHAVEALTDHGWNSHWMTANEPGLFDAVALADAVVVSGGPWGETFRAISSICRSKGAPLICDVDNLTFELEALEAGCVEYFNGLGEQPKHAFLQEAAELRNALATCDAAFATTAPLARAIAKYAARTFVVPNCFSHAMLTAAQLNQAKAKPSSLDGLIRVGFASGTPTHTRNFRTIVAAITGFLSANPRARLVVLGYLDLSQFPELVPYHDQIECRPAVPLERLGEELARFDINLAPLEADNPFCEAKSEIRFTAASSLGIPTVAAASEPLTHAIVDGMSGLLARTHAEWRTKIQQLADDPALRERLGCAARIDTRVRFGPEKTAVLVGSFLELLVGQSHRNPPA